MLRLAFPHLEVGGVVNGPSAQVWRTLTDTRLWPMWGPSVKEVHSPERFIRHGTQGTLFTILGFRLPFVVTEYREGLSWAWKVGGIRATGHRIVSLDGGRRSLLLFQVPLWAFPYAFVCRLAILRIARWHQKKDGAL